MPSYTHENRRGDVIAKTDGTGSLTYQAVYEAYGKRTQENGSTLDRQKANTKDEDPTGLLNEGFRYRDLDTGTFITRDPLGFVDGPNMYAYVRQNPWAKFDLEGLFEIYVHTAGSGHTGASFGEGKSRTNFDFGRYSGKYNWSMYSGPNVLKETTGAPGAANKDGYASYNFNLSKDFDAKMKDAFQSKFNEGNKDLPNDVKNRLPDKNRNLPENERYMGSDWGLSGPNCNTFTINTAMDAANAVLNDPHASEDQKKEANDLKQKLEKMKSNWMPKGTKNDLESMAQKGEVTKASTDDKNQDSKAPTKDAPPSTPPPPSAPTTSAQKDNANQPTNQPDPAPKKKQ